MNSFYELVNAIILKTVRCMRVLHFSECAKQ